MEPTRKVLNWERHETWFPSIEKLIPELCNSTSVDRLRITAPEWVVTDDLDWVRPLLTSNLSQDDSLEDELEQRLLSGFTHLRAYHGCRPINVETYKSEGIVPLDARRFRSRIFEIFGNQRFPEIDDSKIEDAISSVGSDTRDGRVFFECNKSHLLDHGGHYLVYGSEYLVGIARQMSSSKDYAQELKRFGVPTLLSCDVPIRWLHSSTISELVRNTIAAYFSCKIYSDYTHPQVGAGFGFEIFRTLPPELIAEISHPMNVRDPIGKWK